MRFRSARAADDGPSMLGATGRRGRASTIYIRRSWTIADLEPRTYEVGSYVWPLMSYQVGGFAQIHSEHLQWSPCASYFACGRGKV
jgi:hypothetical protein